MRKFDWCNSGFWGWWWRWCSFLPFCHCLLIDFDADVEVQGDVDNVFDIDVDFDFDFDAGYCRWCSHWCIHQIDFKYSTPSFVVPIVQCLLNCFWKWLLGVIYHIQKDSWSLDAQNPPKECLTFETFSSLCTTTGCFFLLFCPEND